MGITHHEQLVLFMVVDNMFDSCCPEEANQELHFSFAHIIIFAKLLATY